VEAEEGQADRIVVVVWEGLAEVGGDKSPLVDLTLFEATWAPRRGTDFFLGAVAAAPSLCFAWRTQSWMNSLFSSIMSAVIPWLWRSRTSESHDSLVNLFSFFGSGETLVAFSALRVVTFL